MIPMCKSLKKIIRQTLLLVEVHDQKIIMWLPEYHFRPETKFPNRNTNHPWIGQQRKHMAFTVHLISATCYMKENHGMYQCRKTSFKSQCTSKLFHYVWNSTFTFSYIFCYIMEISFMRTSHFKMLFRTRMFRLPKSSVPCKRPVLTPDQLYW